MPSYRVPSPIICSGQMRAGTTWLYETFKVAGNVWCPPAKELRLLRAIDEVGTTTCFDRYAAFGKGDGIARDLMGWREVTWRPYLQAMLAQCQTWLDTEFTPWAALEAEFWMTYLGQPHDLALYRRLAELVAPRRLFDATPDYVTLSTDLMLALKDTFDRPPMFIVSLRDPEQRLQSQVRMDIHNGVVRADAPIEAQLSYFEEMQGNFSNFMHINIDHHLDRLVEVFGAKNVFIVFFDDIVNAPNLLCKNLAFFCETPISTIAPLRQNEGVAAEIPEPLASMVKDTTAIVTERLAARLGGHTLNWLEKANGRAPHAEVTAGMHSDRLDRLLR